MSECDYPLVLVTWVDCTTFQGWHKVKDSLELTPDEVQTVGFILADNDTFLHISSSLSGDGEENMTTLSPMMIPKNWVTKVEKLGLAESCKCEEKEGVTPVGEDGVVGLHGQQAILETARDKYWPGAAKEEGGGTPRKVEEEALARTLPLDAYLQQGGTAKGWLRANKAKMDEGEGFTPIKVSGDLVGQKDFESHLRGGGTYSSWSLDDGRAR